MGRERRAELPSPTLVPALVIAALMVALTACGTGSAASDKYGVVVDYVSRQAYAVSAVLDGDHTATALARVEEINRSMRYQAGEPGSSTEEWTGEHAWIAPLATCQDRLIHDGVTPRDAQRACRLASRLWSASNELGYWLDESNAEQDEFWPYDRVRALRELHELVASAESFARG